MSLNPILKSFTLTIKPSLQTWLIIVLPHLLALLLIISIEVFPLWLKFILSIMVTVSFAHYYKFYFTLKLKKSVTLIRQDSRENWFIKLSNSENNEEPKSVSLLPSSFISRFLIVLNFLDKNDTEYSVIIMPDSISSINFKHLYIKLKTTYIKLN